MIEYNYDERECKQSTCTECNSRDLELIGTNFDDLDYYMIEFRCRKCGARLKEIYKLDFIGTDTVVDEDKENL